MTVPPALVLALALLLAGCASAQQVAQRDEERCAAGGAQPNSDAYQDCLLRLETERKVRMDERHRHMMEQPGAPWAR